MSNSPAQLAHIAGAIWLDSGIRRAPNENELASIADRLDPAAPSLDVVRACAEVLPHVIWVLGLRSKRA